MLTEMVLPILERLGMTDKVAAHLQDKRDRLMLLTDYISAGSIASKTNYVGAPLFVGLAIIYQIYDEVDICIFGDTVLFQPKSNPSEDKIELMNKLGFNNMINKLMSQDVLHGHKCEITTIEDCHFPTFVVDQQTVIDTKEAIIAAATQGKYIVAKQEAMKLAYLAWAANTQVDAYNSLNQLFIDIPDSMIPQGVSMRYHTNNDASVSACDIGYVLAPKEYVPYQEAFKDTRALIDLVGPAIRNKQRHIRMKRYAGSLFCYDNKKSFRIISQTLNAWTMLRQLEKEVDEMDGWET
jgi:hypothetical protein